MQDLHSSNELSRSGQTPGDSHAVSVAVVNGLDYCLRILGSSEVVGYDIHAKNQPDNIATFNKFTLTSKTPQIFLRTTSEVINDRFQSKFR